MEGRGATASLSCGMPCVQATARTSSFAERSQSHACEMLALMLSLALYAQLPPPANMSIFPPPRRGAMAATGVKV